MEASNSFSAPLVEPSETEAPARQESIFPLEAWRAAWQCGDAEACRQMAEQAGIKRQATAVSALRKMICPPRSYRGRRRLFRPQWRQVRKTAAFALGRIGHTDALTALAGAMLDLDPEVRQSARFALEMFGSASVPALLETLSTNANWTLDGMHGVIEALGALRDKRATPQLVQILFEQSPVPPKRWDKLIFVYPFRAVVLGFSTLLASLAWNDPEEFFAALWQELPMVLMGGLVAAFFCYLLLVMFVFAPIGSIQIGRERHTLALAASQALQTIQDKRALPRIIQALQYAPFRLRAPLRKTLAALLPLVGPEDTELLKGEALRELTTELGHSDPDIVLAVIQAMEFVGTGQAVKPIERLARRGATSIIRAEAARVLPLLQERARQEDNAASLLRASAMPEAPPEQLLRPLMEYVETPPEQLLRPQQGSPET